MSFFERRSPSAPDKEWVLKQAAVAAFVKLCESCPEVSDIADYIFHNLKKYEDWRDWNIGYPMIMRAHHLDGARTLDLMTTNLGYKQDNSQTWEMGADPNPKLMRYVSFYTAEFLAITKTRHFIHHTDQNQQPVYYDTDVMGKTPTDALEYAYWEAQVYWRFLRNPGNVPLYFTAFPDRRCEACHGGLHCQHHTVKIDPRVYKRTEGNRGFPGFHLRDAAIVTNLVNILGSSGQVDIYEYYTEEQVRDWINRQNMDDQLQKHGLHPIRHQGKSIIPVAARLPLYVFRENLYNPGILALTNNQVEQFFPTPEQYSAYMKNRMSA